MHQKEALERYQYRLAAQDILNITVWNHPELNNPSGQLSSDLAGRSINDDGYFSIHMLGELRQKEGLQQIFGES